MKTFILFVLIFSFLHSASASKDFDFDVPYLTHEQFESLYEADKRTYIIFLRQAAADLSYEDKLSFFQQLNINEPKWVSLFLAQAQAAEPHSREEIIRKLEQLTARARTQSSRPAAGRPESWGDWWERKKHNIVYDPGNEGYISDQDVQDQQLIAERRAVKPIFEERNDIVAMISNMNGDSQRVLRARLRATDPVFNKLFADTMGRARNTEFKERMNLLQQQYEGLFDSPLTIAESRNNGTGVLGLDPSRRPAPRDVTCVRCIYAGFVIAGKQTCDAVNTGNEMAAQLGNIVLPPGTQRADMNCSSPKSVMCNPLVFGLKQNGGNWGALCIAPSASATRSCMSGAGTGQDSIRMTAQLISRNKSYYDRFVTKLRNVCSDVNQCNTAARRQDIRSTCLALRERFGKMSGDFRYYNSPRPAAPPATPRRQSNVGTGT